MVSSFLLVLIVVIETSTILSAIADGVAAQSSIFGVFIAAYGVILGVKMVLRRLQIINDYEGCYSYKFISACDDAGIQPDQFYGNDWEALEDWQSNGAHPQMGGMDDDSFRRYELHAEHPDDLYAEYEASPDSESMDFYQWAEDRGYEIEDVE